MFVNKYGKCPSYFSSYFPDNKQKEDIERGYKEAPKNPYGRIADDVNRIAETAVPLTNKKIDAAKQAGQRWAEDKKQK